MLSTGNFNETKRSLNNYIRMGDFSHPFIIAGWPDSGKSEIVRQVTREHGLYTCVLKSFNLMDDEVDKEIIVNEASIPSSGLKIIEITIGVMMDGLRELLKAGLDVNLLEVDPDEWLQWAQSINPVTGHCNIDKMFTDYLKSNPDRINQGFEFRAENESLLADNVSDILKYNGCDINELYRLIERLHKNLAAVEICRDRAEKIWSPVIDALNDKMRNFSSQDQSRIISLVRKIGEDNSRIYF